MGKAEIVWETGRRKAGAMLDDDKVQLNDDCRYLLHMDGV